MMKWYGHKLMNRISARPRIFVTDSYIFTVESNVNLSPSPFEGYMTQLEIEDFLDDMVRRSSRIFNQRFRIAMTGNQGFGVGRPVIDVLPVRISSVDQEHDSLGRSGGAAVGQYYKPALEQSEVDFS